MHIQWINLKCVLWKGSPLLWIWHIVLCWHLCPWWHLLPHLRILVILHPIINHGIHVHRVVHISVHILSLIRRNGHLAMTHVWTHLRQIRTLGHILHPILGMLRMILLRCTSVFKEVSYIFIWTRSTLSFCLYTIVFNNEFSTKIWFPRYFDISETLKTFKTDHRHR